MALPAGSELSPPRPLNNHFEAVGVWMMGLDVDLTVLLRRNSHATGRTAALHHRTLRSGALQGLLLRRVGAGERRSSAARLSRLLALFGRRRHRTPDGHADA